MHSPCAIEPTEAEVRVRRRATIRGAVQGVGFRPFVYRCASDLGLGGWVANSCDGVQLEVEGDAGPVDSLLRRVQANAPAHSIIQSMQIENLAPLNERAFAVRESIVTSHGHGTMPVDVATCGDCLTELFDPTNRRYRYPFINCTQCGPRYTIVQSLPYDRDRTSMRQFAMCMRCAAEYADPGNRRFHAEPIACPECGPTLTLCDTDGATMATRDEALDAAVALLRAGKILALKSLGGFQLLMDARCTDAIERLRHFKHRPDKPLAILCTSVDQARALCDIDARQAKLLRSDAAPIVLLSRRQAIASDLRPSDSVAPNCPLLGVMLPFTPMHHLLMHDVGVPLVATSGNVSDAPLAFANTDALTRLHGVADAFLIHDRDIVRPCDDSVVRVMANTPVVLRRARGYAPASLQLAPGRPTVLATGAHLKNTATLAAGTQATLGAYVGDLDHVTARERAATIHLQMSELVDGRIDAIAHDLHPDFLHSDFAGGHGAATAARHVGVQHHVAHIAACIGEHDLRGPVLGVAWDGAGYGSDGTLWGGEFIVVDGAQWQRVAHLRTFRLPGGAIAMREPRRVALGVLHRMVGDAAIDHSLVRQWFDARELPVVLTVLKNGVNAPLTSSAGRLFDAAGAIVGLRTICSYEGQAAAQLEWSCDRSSTAIPYTFAVCESERRDAPIIIDWEPAFRMLIDDVAAATAIPTMAARFHIGLANSTVATARRIGIEQVALSGGCFQNRVLLEHTVRALRDAGHVPYWPSKVPPNDGGLSFGQAVWARRVLEACN